MNPVGRHRAENFLHTRGRIYTPLVSISVEDASFRSSLTFSRLPSEQAFQRAETMDAGTVGGSGEPWRVVGEAKEENSAEKDANLGDG